MTAVEIEHIIQYRRKKLYWWHYLGYVMFYSFICFLICVNSLPFVNSEHASAAAMKNISGAMLVVWLTCGILSVRGFRQNIRFISIATPLSKAENKALIIRLLKEDNCKYHTHASGYLSWNAYTSFFNGKEEMEAIPLDNEILINSHPDDKRLFSVFADRNNIRSFEKQVQDDVHHR